MGATASSGAVTDGRGLAKRIRALRGLAGLTQQQAADRSGISRPALSSIENGHRNVQALELPRLAKALKVSVSALLAEECGPVPARLAELLRNLDPDDRGSLRRYADFRAEHVPGARPRY